MARRWTTKEEREKRNELTQLYVNKNKTIREISMVLEIAESSVFDRMKRLDISATPEKKLHYLNKRQDILIPSVLSSRLAEFIGIMLGDGHLSHTQICISISREETKYLKYVSSLIKGLFNITPKYIDRVEENTYDIYVGSVELVKFLKKMGLVSNKVQQQVDIPRWIFSKPKYSVSFLRGFFDTDGSIYSLKFGTQMKFCNRSMPLLQSTRKILLDLKYHPSKISGCNLYLTRKYDLVRYAKEIGFGNKKHFERSKRFDII